MVTVRKIDIAKHLAKKYKINVPVATAIIDDFFEAVIISVEEGHRVELRKFGIFSRRTDATRKPYDRKKKNITRYSHMRFKCSRVVRNRLTEKRINADQTRK